MHASLWIGLMSGTSLDGVDGVLAERQAADDSPAAVPAATARWQLRAHAHRPFPAALREELLALNRPGPDELHRAALATNALMELYATVTAELLSAGGCARGAVRAIGAHGQTVRHRPGDFDGTGYTLQLVNGALLAERTGIDVVCDLRSRDVAASGQGAPLVPAFHASCFAQAGRDVAVLNLGGIGNLTLLHADGRVAGFDTGPGNLLMDLWAARTLNAACDRGGALAARGRVDAALLARLLAEPFFAAPPPKSTGRDLFDAHWLLGHLAGDEDAADVMATLADLTAASATDALRAQMPGCTQLLVCGGGAFNPHLMARLAARAGARCAVGSTAAEGIPPDQVEALAFAWLAAAHKDRRPGNLPAVTGAQGPRVLGAFYPA
jgi:anhydro-N-acetylmuramic acid kinase